jgi:hypothetical protein
MSTQANGHEVPQAAQQPAPVPDKTAQLQILNDINPAIRQVVGVMMRGLLSGCPGVPANVVLSVIAWQVGNLAADTMVADLKTQFALRKSFKDAFEDGVGKAALRQPEMAPGPAMTAPIHLKG